MQAILAQNIGEYVVIEFLIGTENIVRKQGMLYFVGRSFVTLYDEDVNNFIVCDIFFGEVCLLLHARRPAAVQLQPAAACQRGARHGDAPEVRAAFPALARPAKRAAPKPGRPFFTESARCFSLSQQPRSSGLHLLDLRQGLLHGGALAGEVNLDLGLGAGGAHNQLAAVLQAVLQHVGLGQVDDTLLVPVGWEAS